MKDNPTKIAEDIASKVFTDGKEWNKAFKEKMDRDFPKPKVYRGKVTHKSTALKFIVDELEYLVICPAAKSGQNRFYVYLEGKEIFMYDPRGCHVNKTMAEKAVRLAVYQQKLSNS